MAKRYFNRDLSWLSFNQRVLQEAGNREVPLYERLKFLAIYSSNLEEFYRIRVAEWRRLAKLTRKTKKALPERPPEILKKIYQLVRKQQQEFDAIFRNQTLIDLADAKILVLNERNLNDSQKAFVRAFFHDKVQPYLKPIALKSKKTKFALDEKTIYLAVKLCDFDRPGPQKFEYVLVEIPVRMAGRFVVLPDEGGYHCVMMLCDVIRTCIEEVFPDYELIEAYSIKMTRDADIVLEDEFSGNLLKKIKKSLTERPKGDPTRLLCDRSMPADFLQHLRQVFSLGPLAIMPGGRYLNLSDLLNFPVFDSHGRFFNEKMPCIEENSGSIFRQISKKDMLLHFPYHCFEPVIDFLQQAADDKHVQAIYISLYRVGSASRVIKALRAALENGKKVIAFVELKARFDEESNIEYARELEEAGARVLYSFPILKVHAKLISVERTEEGKIKRYAYLGTGNFNENTAKIYVDTGLFTADRAITKEVASVFDMLNDTRIKKEFKHLLVAPDHMRHDLITLIDQEIKNALKGKPASIMLKLNGLQDHRMIDKLYEASSEGVKVKLIIRGICCLIPGVKGMSENIKAISIVDRFLEHNRIYIFGNNGNSKVFLSSADWMERNLSRRFEVAFPVLDPDLKAEVEGMFHIQWNDNVKARVINKTQSNTFRRSRSPIKNRSQTELYKFLQTRFEAQTTKQLKKSKKE